MIFLTLTPSYSAHDPIEDTESLLDRVQVRVVLPGYSAHDPIEDTESRLLASVSRVAIALQCPRSDRGY